MTAIEELRQYGEKLNVGRYGSDRLYREETINGKMLFMRFRGLNFLSEVMDICRRRNDNHEMDNLLDIRFVNYKVEIMFAI